jgi:hypothetical protein
MRIFVIVFIAPPFCNYRIIDAISAAEQKIQKYINLGLNNMDVMICCKRIAMT